MQIWRVALGVAPASFSSVPAQPTQGGDKNLNPPRANSLSLLFSEMF
jgi:hypothetical protein